MQGLLDRISVNYQRELEEKEIIDVSLNRVFLGSPGTGKLIWDFSRAVK